MLQRHTINLLGNKKHYNIGEIIRFAVVGTLATLLQYGVYLICLTLLNKHISLTIGYIVSFIFNYIASTYFTFRVKAGVKRGAGFVFSHIVNYLLQMFFLSIFTYVGVSKPLAPLPTFAICVPINFCLVRYFLKK